MDIKQLKRFLDICETLNFTKTAENLYISQQALSNSISALEKDLGKPLFKRMSKGVILTEEGALLKKLCSPVIQQFDDLSEEIERQFHPHRGHLRLGLAPFVLQASAPDLILQFRQTHQNIEVKGSERRDAECVKDVINGITQLAFCPKPVNCSGLTYIPLGAQKLYVVVNRLSPLAKKKSISLAELQQEKLVSFSKHHHIHQQISQCFRNCGIQPNYIVETGEVGVLMSMVELNMHTFICMEYLARDINKKTCTRIPLSDPGIMWEYGLIYQKDTKPDYATEQFISFAKRKMSAGQ